MLHFCYKEKLDGKTLDIIGKKGIMISMVWCRKFGIIISNHILLYVLNIERLKYYVVGGWTIFKTRRNVHG